MRTTLALSVLCALLCAWPAAVRAACDCGSASCTGTSATVAAPTAGAGYNITFTFDDTYTCGQYVNGDYWVVVAGDSEVVISTITPTLVGTGSTLRNGWDVNILGDNETCTAGNTPHPCCSGNDAGDCDEQPFDGRVTSDYREPGYTLPYTASAGDAIVKLASDTPAGDCSAGHKTCGMHAAVLMVLASTPSTTSTLFRPPFTGGSGNRTPVLRTTDIEDYLLDLDVSGFTNDITQAAAERHTRSFRLDYVTHYNQENFGPEDATTDNAVWGGDKMKYDMEVLLWLNTNEVSAANRQQTLYNIIQHGIDNYGAFETGTSFLRGGGGNGAGAMTLFAFAATMLNDSTMQTSLSGAAQNMFWETDSYYLGENDIALWGQRSNSTESSNEQVYWYDLSEVAASQGTHDRKSRDPYAYIDGGASPGSDYQSHNAKQTKYLGLLTWMIPEILDDWPAVSATAIQPYADRWTDDGAHTQPDPCAPVDARDAGCNPGTDCSHYGNGCSADPDCTWGPTTPGTGSCIVDGSTPPEGRYPALHDTLADTGNRASLFGDEMWTAFRDDFGSEVCGDGLVTGAEECDDDGVATGDGCDDNCEVEDGWSCDGEDPTSCNRAPVFANDTLNAIDEDASNDDPVDTVNTATDADSDGLTYAIISQTPDDGVFAIHATTRAVTVADNTNLDYETTASYDLVVRVTDDGTPVLTDDATITAPIGDVAESTCGDGAVEEAEECDDSNTTRKDGCDNTCEIEKGWTCSGDPSVCAADPDYVTPINLLHTIRKGGCCPRGDVR